jgi:mannan endo-1,4-beta-mannosidase
VSPAAVGQYRQTTATVTVANEGDAVFDSTLDITVGDTTAETAALSVPPGETTQVSTEFTRGRVGEHTVTATVETGSAAGRLGAETTVVVEPLPAHHVTVDGTALHCGDGQAFYGGASLANAADVKHQRRNEAPMAEAFDTLSALDVTSARIWGFAPAWADIDSMPAPGEYNDRWFEYFDRVVVEAKKRDIRLFVPLFNGNPAYGPISEEDFGVNVPGFVNWADDAQTRNDFFDSEDCWQLYAGWVERLVTNENHLTGVEYRDDPTIAMWELGNEIQHSPPRVGESIRPWIERAGAFVKELDDQTLLTTGSYGHQGRNAFVDEAGAAPIDVVSIHYYPGPEHYDMPEDDVLPTLRSTIETVHSEIGKPLYVGEYNWGVGPDDSAPYEERAEWVGRLQQAFRDNGVAATNFHTVADQPRPTSYHKPATVYAPNEELTLDAIATHARRTREQSSSSCLSES